MADLAAEPAAVAGAPALPERSRCGMFSLVLAGCACAAAIAALVVFAQTPKTAPDLVQNIVTVCFIAVFLVAAPLAHVTGFVLGLVALFRPHDRRLVGAFGMIANGVVIVGWAVVIWAVLKAGAAFR